MGRITIVTRECEELVAVPFATHEAVNLQESSMLSFFKLSVFETISTTIYLFTCVSMFTCFLSVYLSISKPALWCSPHPRPGEGQGQGSAEGRRGPGTLFEGSARGTRSLQQGGSSSAVSIEPDFMKPPLLQTPFVNRESVISALGRSGFKGMGSRVEVSKGHEGGGISGSGQPSQSSLPCSSLPLSCSLLRNFEFSLS